MHAMLAEPQLQLETPEEGGILLSVVVPSFNCETFLELCMQSMRACWSPRVEFLFIDGGSSDGTMAIVERYREIFALVVSEKDRGQSDALNKGFARAKGRYVTWLNADDCFVPAEFARLLAILAQGDADWYACNQLYVDERDRIVKFLGSGAFEIWALRFGVLHVFGPSTILRRSLFERHGPFLEAFHYAMDSEYWRRLAAAGVRYRRLELYLWAFRLHGGSKTAASITASRYDERMRKEVRMIDEQYMPGLSEQKKRVGFLLARFNRVLNGAYPKAAWMTLRYRGQARTERWG